MLYLGDTETAQFEGNHNSGRRKGSRNKVRRSEVVYKTEQSPVQKLREISTVYRNFVSPTASLLQGGVSAGNLAYRLQGSGASKTGILYDKVVGRTGKSVSVAKGVKGLFRNRTGKQ